MAAPKTQFAPYQYQNPHAKERLTFSIPVISNTDPETVVRHIRENSVNYENWLQLHEETDTPAVIVGGGDSINDCVDEIRALKERGATVYGLNAASKWCHEHGIDVDYQVILDAQEHTADLVDTSAGGHLFASQCHPKTFEQVDSPVLWHFIVTRLEEMLPENRKQEGGYALIGGDSTVGICSMCVAYTMGHRDLHIFGLDSSYRDGKSHAYDQKVNEYIPVMKYQWGEREFYLSIAMKYQAEKFMVYAKALEAEGAKIYLYGDGLTQTIYNTPLDDLTEQQKYQMMWNFHGYREISPGEFAAGGFIEKFNPKGSIIDFGCGTGRGGVELSKGGLDVTLMDFTDNCRDEEALFLPFIQWDLTLPIPISADYGFCTDVMEHIPTDDVDTVIKNIMSAVGKCYFQISTVPDTQGAMIDAELHLTVRPHNWWKKRFKDYQIEFASNLGDASILYVSQ